MKKYIILLAGALTLSGGCKKNEEFLDIKPTNILLLNEVYGDPRLVLSVVTDLYNRIPDYQEPSGVFGNYANFDEAYASKDPGRHRFRDYNYNDFGYYDYGYIREINLFLERVATAEKLTASDKARFLAEGRYLRANAYFEMVKRMGGVPLILESLTYDFSGDPSYLRKPRAKEAEMYDFVIKEMEEIKSILPKTPNEKSRATYGLALATKARAALYAGSIAKYGVNTPTVSLPGGEVGIPASMATGYFQTSLAAAEELIKSGQYSLYRKIPDLSDNFANIFLDKGSNPEVIFVEDYKLKTDKLNNFTLDNQPRGITEEGDRGGWLNPSLNLVQSFQKLDNTFAPLPIKNGSTEILYDKPEDLFVGRDARLRGTVLVPGSTFKGKDVDMFAGLILPNGNVISGSQFGELKRIPESTGPFVQVVGKSGPIQGLRGTAETGFYMRKHLDPNTASGQIGTQSEVWNVRYRYAEVLLIAAEAAFHLNQPALAATYMNQVRERAGLVIPLTAADMSLNRFVLERRAEFAFENHQLWDYKRWRIAHVVWNGSNPGLTNDPGNALDPSTRVYGLYPYKIYNPGQPNHNKWLFRNVNLASVSESHNFRLGNYYSRIDDAIINENPLIVRNPNQ